MPEGDTIFRAAATLQRALGGERVVRFGTPLPRLARVDEDHPIAGRTVDAVTAAGKHVLMCFSGGLVLRTHMRMNGSWHLYRPGERWRRPRAAMRVTIETAPWVAVAFDVPVAEWLDARALARQEDLARMGPDLLAAEFDAAEAARRVRARPAEEIGDVLLNQRVLAGIGNVFKSEILFVAGVDPFRAAGSLSDDELARILAVSRDLLRVNAGGGAGARAGSAGALPWTVSRRTTRRANPSERLWVYGRGGEPCRRCGAPIAFARQGPHARVTYRCPRCQPTSDPHVVRR